jgi:hypothetical protein
MLLRLQTAIATQRFTNYFFIRIEVDRIQLELDGKLLAESENDLEVHQTAKKIAIVSC